MNGALAVFRKDFRLLTRTSPALFLFAVFSAVTGFFFYSAVLYFHVLSLDFTTGRNISQLMPTGWTETVISPFFMNVCVALLAAVPLLTMRSLAEEKRAGTFELLLTYPVSDTQIIFGKYLALLAALSLLIAPTVSYFVLLYWMTGFSEPQVLAVAYLGVFLFSSLLICIGMLISSVSKSQTLSAALSFFFYILLWSLGWTSEWISPEWSHWIRPWWVVEHLRTFTRGVCDTTYVAFYLIASAFFLFVTILMFEIRNWKR